MAEHLTEEQLATLRRRLHEEQARLRETLREELRRQDEQHYRDLAGQVHDEAEESVADLLADLDLELLERHKRDLLEVEAALERMRQGRYGICEESGEPIMFERLLALPTARRSAEWQRRYEQNHSGGGRSSL